MIKKVSLLLVLVLMVFSLLSCSSTQSTEDYNTQSLDSTSISQSETTIPLDKDELSALIVTAKAIPETKYTTATYNSLQTALTHAGQVLSDRNITQATVDAEVIRLQAAIDSLKMFTSYIWEISVFLSCTAKNHVGNDWSTKITYNGSSVYDTFTVTASEGTSISLTGQATENDNIPDTGSGTLRLTLRSGATATTTFYVRENRGRYSGYQATWVLEARCEISERV